MNKEKPRPESVPRSFAYLWKLTTIVEEFLNNESTQTEQESLQEVSLDLPYLQEQLNHHSAGEEDQESYPLQDPSYHW